MKKVPPKLLVQSRRLRSEMTDAERALWQRLRGRQLGGFKFKRQFVFGPYILDFYCERQKLSVELDGGHHAEAEQKTYDAQRTEYLETVCIKVVRYWNDEVLKNTDGVLSQILDELQAR